MQRSWLDEQRERYERASDGSGIATGVAFALAALVVCAGLMVWGVLAIFF